jgi:hypothetical protein
VVRTIPLLILFAAGTAVAAPLTDAIRSNAYPLTVTNGKLDGKGATLLRTAITAANFVMLGEDHGIAQIPALGSALCAELAPAGFRYLALEVGATVAPELEAFARAADGATREAAFVKQYPETIAFYEWKEELAMLAACEQAAPYRLWGVDQELMGAPVYVLPKILATKPGPTARAAIEALIRDVAAAREVAAKTGDYMKLWLLSAKQATLDAAKASLAKDGSAEAQQLFAALLESRAIYLGYMSGQDYVSNRRRARLMKGTFLDDLSTAAKADKASPKVLLKFGAWHMYRGLNPLRSNELGNMISEDAEGHKVEAVNLLVLGVKGSQLALTGLGRAPAPHPLDLATDKDSEFKFLAPFYAELGKDWTLFDLRPLRPAFAKLRPVDPELERVIFGFDFLVLIPAPTPSHPLFVSP